jgi:uncharacterized protein YndB with AHSA1/START domain
MAHPFEVRKEIEVQATPEEIWEAIATGAGIDGWFLGTGNEVEPRLGGRVVINVGGEMSEDMITAWEPPHRLAYGGQPDPNGVAHAFEYVIEARGGGTSVVRLVHSGFLGDDWETEFEALGEGDFMYLHLMAQYVTHFRGRPTTILSIFRPEPGDGAQAVAQFRRAMGLGDTVAEGDPVRFDVDGGTVEGVIDFVSPTILGVRSDDALYRFMYSPMGVVFLGHHLYGANIDADAARVAWQAWLDRAFEGAPA